MSNKDYLAMRQVDPEDQEAHGIKGMRWGFRRSKAEIASAGKSGDSKSPSKESATKEPEKKAGPESSSQKYDRLVAQSKKEGANVLSDEDLRFVTQRADAIAKVNRLHQQNPNFIVDATKTALKNAAKREMQNLAAGIAKKYISDELLGSTKK